MSNLTQVAKQTRKIVKISLFVIIAITILTPVSKGIRTYWIKTHPEPAAPPNMSFGKLPSIKFGSEASYPAGLQFELKTISGSFPDIGQQSRVYFITILGPSFFDEEYTRQKASQLGFTQQLGKIGSNRFAFLDPVTKANLKIDTINNNFEINYPFHQDLFFKDLTAPTEQTAFSLVRNVVTQMGLWQDDFDADQANYIYLKYDQQKSELVKALSLSEAQLTRVNLKRKDLDNLPIMPPHLTESNVSLIVSSAGGGKTIVFAKYICYPINYERYATYPLKSAVTAWEELKKGQAFISHLGNNNDEKPIAIRKIYLAYFAPELPQKFLQPIFIFEGDDEFRAYVTAIKSSWIQDKAETEN